MTSRVVSSHSCTNGASVVKWFFGFQMNGWPNLSVFCSRTICTPTIGIIPQNFSSSGLAVSVELRKNKKTHRQTLLQTIALEEGFQYKDCKMSSFM